MKGQIIVIERDRAHVVFAISSAAPTLGHEPRLAASVGDDGAHSAGLKLEYGEEAHLGTPKGCDTGGNSHADVLLSADPYLWRRQQSRFDHVGAAESISMQVPDSVRVHP